METPELARPCTICTHPDLETIDNELLAGTSYRDLAKRFGVGVSSVFRHRRYHLTALIAKALEAREVRDLNHGDDMLSQLEFLNTKTLRILADAEKAGDRRGALAAIREARSTIELNAKLCRQILDAGLASPATTTAPALDVAWRARQGDGSRPGLRLRAPLLEGGGRPEHLTSNQPRAFLCVLVRIIAFAIPGTYRPRVSTCSTRSDRFTHKFTH